jgi:hypothetical protein
LTGLRLVLFYMTCKLRKRPDMIDEQLTVGKIIESTYRSHSSLAFSVPSLSTSAWL